MIAYRRWTLEENDLLKKAAHNFKSGAITKESFEDYAERRLKVLVIPSSVDIRPVVDGENRRYFIDGSSSAMMTRRGPASNISTTLLLTAAMKTSGQRHRRTVTFRPSIASNTDTGKAVRRPPPRLPTTSEKPKSRTGA